MQLVLEFFKRHSLIAGITLMFLLTWPIDLANAGVINARVPFAIALTLGWGFILASLMMTGLTLGKQAVISLIKRFLIWRVGWRWYLIAFLLYPSVFVSAIMTNAVLTRTPVDFSDVFAARIFGASASLPGFVLPFFIFEFLTNGEEMGWRGYVLPRLQAKYNALAASLILGLVWGFWHLPKYLAPENTGSFGLMLVKTLADSVIYAWMYNNTKGSLLLTTILHAAGNTAGVFLPIANTQLGTYMNVYITAILFLMLVAVIVIVVSGPETLSRTKLKQVQEQSLDEVAAVHPA